jgi:hypothetical protein
MRVGGFILTLLLVSILAQGAISISDVQKTVIGDIIYLSFNGIPPYLINIRGDADYFHTGGYVWAKTNANTFSADLSFAVNPIGKYFFGISDSQSSYKGSFSLGNNGSCGDGVCDTIEKNSGKCPEDCSTNSSCNNSAGTLVEKGLITVKSEAGSQLARPDTVVINDNIYLGYLRIPQVGTGSFHILKFDKNFTNLGDTAVYSADKEGYFPTDMRMAAAGTSLFYPFETAKMETPSDQCLNRLNVALYDASGATLQQTSIQDAVACGYRVDPSSIPIGKRVVDDPAPFFWQNKMYVFARSFMGPIQYVYVFDPALTLIESFQLDLSAPFHSISPDTAETVYSIVAINGTPYLIGALQNGPAALGGVGDLYAIRLAKDLKSSDAKPIPLITNTPDHEEYVVGARVDNNRLYVTYNIINQKSPQDQSLTSGWLAVFDVSNKFSLIGKYKINDRDPQKAIDNHITVEVLGNQVYAFYQSDDGKLMAKSFEQCNDASSTENKKSEVRTENGKAKLYIGNTVYTASVTEVYNYAGDPSPPFPKYGTSGWNDRMKQVIDSAKSTGTGIVMPGIWWSDVEKTKGTFDFSSMDEIMKYAQKEGVYIMPLISKESDAPDWWRKENNFPPYDDGKTCDFCETDSYGNVYDNPSMNSGVAHESYTKYLDAMIGRYKDHPALAGWVTGIGPSSEDGFGPNGLSIKGANNGGQGRFELKPLMYTDYSPFFEREFKAWIKVKYASDRELQSAWNAKSVTLDNVSIPMPKELLLDPTRDVPFPDEGRAVGGMSASALSTLSAKGKDFYEFRTKMENAERNYYANFFKAKDPNHVVLFRSPPTNQTISSNFNGVAGTWTACFDCTFDSGFRSQEYQLIMKFVRLGSAQDKVAHFIFENGNYEIGENESTNQIALITAFGKAVKCAGGLFGYVSDLAPIGSKIRPNWYSAAAQNAIKEINNYTPDATNCECNIIKDLWQKANCESSEHSIGCTYIANDYSSYCNVKLPSFYTNQSNSPCGDGVCDAIEKSSGMCPADCN